MLLTGAKLVWVETRAELDRAINPRTAMLFFLNRYEPLGQIKREEWIRVGKERGVPLFNDAAADVPPAARFSEYLHQGFDLVAFSGGKGLRGPQASGLLLGRPDLIAAGRRAISPAHGHRPRDEGRQGRDHRLAGGRRAVPQAGPRRRMAAPGRPALSEMIDAARRDPRHERAARRPRDRQSCRPSVVLEWSRWHSKRSAEEVVQQLWDGDPRIAVLAEGERGLRIMVWTLRDDEHRIVAQTDSRDFQGCAVLNESLQPWLIDQPVTSPMTSVAGSRSLARTPLLGLELERCDLLLSSLALRSSSTAWRSSSAMVWA